VQLISAGFVAGLQVQDPLETGTADFVPQSVGSQGVGPTQSQVHGTIVLQLASQVVLPPTSPLSQSSLSAIVARFPSFPAGSVTPFPQPTQLNEAVLLAVILTLQLVVLFNLGYHITSLAG